MAAGDFAPNNANDTTRSSPMNNLRTNLMLVSWFQTYPGLAPRLRRAGPTCLFPPQAHFWVLLQEGKEGCRRPATARRLRKIKR